MDDITAHWVYRTSAHSPDTGVGSNLTLGLARTRAIVGARRSRRTSAAGTSNSASTVRRTGASSTRFTELVRTI